MKRNSLIIVFAFLWISAFGQSEEFNFKPAWRAGEKKKIHFVQERKEYESGQLIKDTVEYLDAEVHVLKETKDAYSIKLLYQNIVLRSAKKFYDRFDEELSSYKTLELLYTIDKATGKAHLTNWEQARSFMVESFEQITVLMEEKTPEHASQLSLMLQPIISIFDSQENTEAYFEDEIGFLFFPFGKKFVTDDTLKITESVPNPFNPMDTIQCTTYSYLDNINKANKTCSINTRIEMDMSEFTNMLKTMMRQMMEGFKVEDSIVAMKEKEIDEIQFDMQHTEVISLNYSTGWPSKVVKSVRVQVVDPKHDRLEIGTVTITFK